jgi:hypothetical protein
VKTVLAAVSSYTIAALVGGGQTNPLRAAQLPVVINPYFSLSRTDTAYSNTSFCGNTFTKWFTQALLHEARHAYHLDYARNATRRSGSVTGGAAAERLD